MVDKRKSRQAKEGANALAERAFLASIVDSTDDAIIGKTLDGIILSWNAAAETMYGYSAQEVLGKSILMVVPPDRQDEIPRILARIKNGERVEHYETKRLNRSGRQMNVSVTVSPIMNASGQIAGASTIARDISDRLRADEASQKAFEYSRSLVEASAERALLASIVEYSDDAIIGKTLDGTILSWNAAAEKMYGLTAEQAIGKSILVVVPPDRQDEIPQILERIKAGETVEHYETKRMDKYGKQIHVSVTVSPIKDADGEIVGASTVARDISDRKRAEEALHRASAYTRSLIEASLDPLVTISAEGKITDVNTGTERVTGYSRNELIGADFSDYFTDPSKARAGYQQVFRDGLVKDYELEIRHRDGQLTPVMYNASVYRAESGQIAGVFAAARDISDRKRAEEALQAASAYNRSLIEASLDPLVTISAEGKITDVNMGTERVTGYSRNELIGTDFADYFTDPARARAGYQQVFRDGLVKDYELEIRHRDGQLTPVMYNASVYRDESGKVTGVFAAARDISDRKRAEEALQAASAYNRSLIEASLDPLVTISAEGKITDVNTGTERVTGYSRNELIGADFADYFTDPSKARAGYQQVFRDGSVKDYELEIRHRDGQLTPVMYNASVYSDEPGKVLGVFAAARDISDRKDAEKALQAASAYNRSLIEASLDPLVTISAEGKVTDVNTATERVTGYSREELIGTDFTNYFTDPEKASAGYQKAFKDGSVRDYELEIQHKDGELTPVMYNASLYQDESGQIIGLFAAARDITESKRAEKALQQANAYNRSLIEASLDPLVTISAEGKITDVNTATERVTGYQRSELIGTEFADYFTDPLRARDGYQQVFRDGSVKDYELEIRHKNGTLTQVTYNASLYYDEFGKIIGLFAAARDISARKQAERERERLIEELEAKNAELERFTYSVSHDLRSPLITIRSFLGFVSEAVSNGNTENLKPDLERIDKAAEKMGQLLGEILELSRVGRMFNPPTEVQVDDIISEAMELLSGTISQRGVQVQIAPDLPVLYVDRPRILEVFQNLIENSMKFMGDQSQPRIEIGTKREGEETVLFVRDNGIGINPLYHEKVFGLFNKLDQKTEGTGIGLALAKRIVEVHGGRMWVESKGIGKGSAFCFTLPCPVPGK
ncbi:MAG: PAS domain S-box protein [Thermodesulfobacteriota bacterium]